MELVRDFLNTLDVEAETDELNSPAELALWLHERGLAEEGARAGEDDLVTALALREGLRSALRRGGPAVLPVLPMTLRIDGKPRWEPVEGGVRGALARIAAQAARPGWERLKVCAEEGCQWAFIDASRNRSRSWCSMRLCGNRTKTRAYRARKAGSRPPLGSNTDTV
ncbi:MAG: CGNR zinc finger domain-containing protein [Nonomuraea sp.]|nr:CGNR zinc finger domain-containing protein [Nonomuraea sp.]